MSRDAIRLTGLAGVASFALIVVGTLLHPLWEIPATTASAAEVGAYLREHREEILASLLCYCLSWGFFVCFAAGLWGLMRATEPDPGVLSAVFAFGAVILSALVFAGFVPFWTAAYREVGGTDAQVLRDLAFGLLAMSGVPTAVCLTAYAEHVRRNPIGLPGWTAWLAMMGAAAHLLIATSLLWRSGFFSLEGEVIVVVPGTLFAWFLAVAILLLRRHSRPGTPPG